MAVARGLALARAYEADDDGYLSERDNAASSRTQRARAVGAREAVILHRFARGACCDHMSCVQTGSRVCRDPHASIGVPLPCGPVAQLGARMNGIHEVTGSIPVWSTKSSFSVLISRK